ncbi:MAG: DUF4350 domain-containing protein [Actinomycetia bacterium]|nr:DUF4350 domain-containing protein [Actinomycetes bacterium]
MTVRRRRPGRWVALGLLAIIGFAVITAWLTAPRLGGRMDPEATSPNGAHALVALLRQQGVEVVVAETVDDVERAARPDALVLVAETSNTRGQALLDRLASVPGDLLVVEPNVSSREVLASGVTLSRSSRPESEPNCALREANRAGSAQLETGDTYGPAGDDPVTRCYGGVLVRYSADGRAVTVVGTADFMTNGSLLKEGNAALAMNLTGDRSRLIWYAPQSLQGERSDGAEIGDLLPDAVFWVVAQLCLVVVLLGFWQGRRLGPLVAEQLPVVVRASETVQGRARLYRSRRARGQAAAALRAAVLQRVTPRLGLGHNPSQTAVVTAVSRRSGTDDHAVQRILFGPPPDTDSALFHLAQALDDIERQVSQS